MNFLKETIEAIHQCEHTPEDIIFIGSEESGHSCTWEEFTILADINYDKGHGAQEIASDLVIVFNDGIEMWRSEYDGSEWWEYQKPFKKPDVTLPIETLCVSDKHVGWKTLAELHGEEEDEDD